MTRPGARLRALAQRFCDRATMARLIDPVIADLQHEHDDAVRSGRRWRACAVRIAGALAFWKVTVITMASASARQPSWATADDGAVGRTIRVAGIATTVTTALLVWPPMRHAFAASSDWDLFILILYLLPQALAMTLPMGLVFGVLCGVRHPGPTRRTRLSLALLMLAASSAALVLNGWLLPAGNQAFRQLAFALLNPDAGGALSRGINELTLGELLSIDAYQFHARLALASAPLVLGAFSLVLATAKRGRSHAVIAGLTALALCFTYYILLLEARELALGRQLLAHGYRVPGAVAAWGPNLLAAAAALLLHLRTRGRSAADPSRRDDGRRSADQPAVPPA